MGGKHGYQFDDFQEGGRINLPAHIGPNPIFDPKERLNAQLYPTNQRRPVYSA